MSKNVLVDGKNRPAKWFVALISAAWGILFLPALIFAIFVVLFGFDEPGSETNPLLWIFVLTIVSFPIVCGFAVGFSIQALQVRQFRKACWFVVLPLINMAVAVIVNVIVSGLLRT